MPRHLADRIAILELSPDLHQICLPIENVTKELDRRSIRYRVANRQDTDEYAISLVGKNLITLRMRSSGGCTSRLHFEQITDIADNIGAPVVFSLDSSIDTNANALNDAAVAKLDAVVRHISAVRLGRIEIYQNLASGKSSQQKKAAQRLASLVRDSLVEKGISPTKIRIYGASTPVPNQLLSWEKRSAEAEDPKPAGRRARNARRQWVLHPLTGHLRPAVAGNINFTID